VIVIVIESRLNAVSNRSRTLKRPDSFILLAQDAAPRKRGRAPHNAYLLIFSIPDRSSLFTLQFDAVCLVVDVGLTCSSSGFLASCVKCASEILQRKLFSESSARFGLVQCGTKTTNNSLDYANVTLMERGLAVADWTLLEFVQKHVQGEQKFIKVEYTTTGC
jgi:hypothetical protein